MILSGWLTTDARMRLTLAMTTAAALITTPALANQADAIRQSHLMMEHWQCEFYAADFEDQTR